MSILETKELKTYFPITGGVFQTIVNHVKAVNGVSISVNSGEIISVVGESGCGKSTLGLSVLGLVPITQGSITLEGRSIDVKKMKSWAQFRQHFQIIFQDPFTSLNPRHSIFRILSEGMLVHKICKKNGLKAATEHLMEQVGLSTDYLNRFPHEFSGGQRQRIAIARAIAVKPKLIVCDEVVSALDVSVQAQIIQLLLDLKQKMNLSLLFISHDLSLVKSISDRVYVMYLGSIMESSKTKDIFSNPFHPYTQALLDSIPTLNRQKKPTILTGEVPSPVSLPQGCVFKSRCPKAQEKCGGAIPPIQKINNREVACFFPLNQ